MSGVHVDTDIKRVLERVRAALEWHYSPDDVSERLVELLTALGPAEPRPLTLEDTGGYDLRGR